MTNIMRKEIYFQYITYWMRYYSKQWAMEPAQDLQ